MNEAPDDFLWTETDNNQAKKLGWSLSPVYTFGGDIWVKSEPKMAGYQLMWENPAKLGVVGDPPDIIEIIAECASRGDPLYEKAWRAYCYLDLTGRIVRDAPTNITSYGDPVRQ